MEAHGALREEIEEAKRQLAESRAKLDSLQQNFKKYAEIDKRNQRNQELDQRLHEYQQQYGANAPTRLQLEQQPRNSYWIPFGGGCWNVGE